MSAINTSHRDPGESQTMQEWLDTYGPPDLVTCGSAYSHRSIIWAEEGILVVINIDFDEDVQLILFPPIPIEELADS